jgi:glutathione S-transferase
MITVYYLPTPNGRKVAIALEEMGIRYEIKLVDVYRLEAQTPEYLKICPNGKIPALVDGSLKIFESAAILQHLGRRTGLYYPTRDEIARSWIDSWLFWQMSALGPMSGQITWFRRAARKEGRDPNETSLALHRYNKEVQRLYAVLERQLEHNEYICNEYSLADMACWPWVNQHGEYAGNLEANFPAVFAWHARIAERPAVRRALLVGIDVIVPPTDLKLDP